MSDFQGFDQANTTAVPDVFFDELLPTLSGAECKVMLYIIRRTLGFKKTTDAISFNQFKNGITTHDGRVLDKGCGVQDRTTLSKALASLEAKNCIETTKGKNEKKINEITAYSIKFRSQGSRENLPPVVGKSYQGSRKNPQGVVGKSYPQLDSNTTNSETKESVVVTNTLPQPEITHSFPQVDDYTTSATIAQETPPSMELSTQANGLSTTVGDNSSPSEHGSASYSHRPDTSPATNVGRLGVLEVPITHGIEGVIAAPPTVQRTPAAPTPKGAQDQPSEAARAIRRMYDRCAGYVTGHADWEWKKMEEMALDLQEAGTLPTKDDMQLVYDHLKTSKLKYTVAHVWEAWSLLPSLKKPVQGWQPKAFNADDLPEDVWATS